MQRTFFVRYKLLTAHEVERPTRDPSELHHSKINYLEPINHGLGSFVYKATHSTVQGLVT